jgi:hypothetical protein
MAIKFKGRDILQDGILVGELQGTTSEVWVVLFKGIATPVAVGRFKYFRPMTSAKRFIKFLLGKFSPEEIAQAIGFDGTEKEAPIVWAEKHGFPKRQNT